MPKTGWLIGVLGLALAAEPTHPQQITRTVKVEESEQGRMHWLLPKINQEVIAAFEARIGSSARYTLGQYNLTQTPAELHIVIVCQDSPKASAAGFCTYKIEYSPKNIPEFNMPLGEPKVISRPDAAGIAEDIFQDFVKETTETRLTAAESEVTLRVANFCSKPENQMPCSGKFQ